MKNIITNRKIIDILIGDTSVDIIENEEVFLPYLSGSDLVSFSNELGYSTFYNNSSRWVYMEELIEHLYNKNDVSKLFEKVFSLQHFVNHINGENPAEIKSKHKQLVQSAMRKINGVLLFFEVEIRKSNTGFYIHSTNDSLIIDKKIKSVVTQDYITSLEERVQWDLVSANYDSVLTKCRTIIEEVLIYIVENLGEEVDSKGDIVKLYNQVKQLLNIQQRKEFDNKVNQLLKGIESIIRAISDMRNLSGDAHGKGSDRIIINKREAELVINSTITICLYLINIFEDQQTKISD